MDRLPSPFGRLFAVSSRAETFGVKPKRKVQTLGARELGAREQAWFICCQHWRRGHTRISISGLDFRTIPFIAQSVEAALMFPIQPMLSCLEVNGVLSCNLCAKYVNS